MRLGCESAALFAAVATVTGVLGNESSTTDDFGCDLATTGGLPIPLLHIHGTDDATVGYQRVARGIETYRELNRCGAVPIETYSRGTASCVAYPCPAASNVTLCSVEGGGHEWSRTRNVVRKFQPVCMTLQTRQPAVHSVAS